MTKPRQFSYDGLFGRSTRLSFDAQNFYVQIDAKQQVVLLTDVLSLSKTGTKLNSRYVWELTYHADGKSTAIRFRPKNTLWNANFRNFYIYLDDI